MNTIKVETLKPEQSFKGDLLLDKLFILLGAGQPVTSEFIKELAMWNITEVLLDGTNPFEKPAETEKINEAYFEDVNINGEPVQEAPKMNTSIKEALAKAQGTSNEKSRLYAVLNVYNEYMTYIFQ